MANPTPARAAAEAYATERCEFILSVSERELFYDSYEDAFLAGHAWTLKALSEQAGEFDVHEAERASDRPDKEGSWLSDAGIGFVDGARWQHARDAAVIAGLMGGSSMSESKRYALFISHFWSEGGGFEDFDEGYSDLESAISGGIEKTTGMKDMSMHVADLQTLKIVWEATRTFAGELYEPPGQLKKDQP